jgi:hypothetical protein
MEAAESTGKRGNEVDPILDYLRRVVHVRIMVRKTCIRNREDGYRCTAFIAGSG